MQITTLVCTYRRPRLLARALASLVLQTSRDFDVKVFDNASGDETPNVIEWFRKKGLNLEYTRHKENIGMAGNFRHALSSPTSSPYIHILNDDDYILPDLYEHSLSKLEESSNVAFHATNTAYSSLDNQVSGTCLGFWRRWKFAAGEGSSYMAGHNHPILTSILFRKDLFSEFGGFDFSFGYAFDFLFEVMVSAKYPISCSPETGGVFCIYPEQASSQNNISKNLHRELFSRLKPSDFLSPESFASALRSSAFTQIRAMRDVLGSGLNREVACIKELIILMQRHPERSLSAIGGYLDMMRDITERKRLGTGYFADAEKIRMDAQLKVDKTQPALMALTDQCLEETGMSSVEK